MSCISPNKLERKKLTPGLWSLWEMLELKAGAFVEVFDRISQTFAWLSAMEANNDSVFHKDRRLDDVDKKFIRGRIEGLPEHLTVLGAQLSAMSAQEAVEYLQLQHANWAGVKQRLDVIRGRVTDELRLAKVFALEANRHNYYTPSAPLFGSAFAAKYQSAAFELDEAAKCLALSRPTAAVFHLMRLMEIGIVAFARCLGIPDPIKPADRNWGAMLRTIWQEIERRWPSPASRTTGDGHTFEGLFVSLDAVKNPWRNATMHVENKYTDEEAEHIFFAVRGFMKGLADRCDEKGSPLS